MKTAILPGSYDPITNGHLDIIKRASDMYDKIIVAVGKNSEKQYTLTVKQRLKLINDAIKDIKNASAEAFDGLLVDYIKTKENPLIVKGIRDYKDYVYEYEMAKTNKELSKTRHGLKAETILLVSDKKYSSISSTRVKELINDEETCSKLVPNYSLLIEVLEENSH